MSVAKNSFWQDLKLLFRNQLRVNLNSFRQQWKRRLIGWGGLVVLFLSLFGTIGSLTYGALANKPPEVAQGLLSLIFMVGLAGQIFFGVTAAFASLYMSEDLELLFMTPVALKAVFLVKSVSVLASNFALVLLFVVLPGVYCGILFQAGAVYYLLVFLVGCGLWLMGTALAELLNLVVMRVVPRHRSKEAIGFIGAFTGILMALAFQIPSLMMNSGQKADIGIWLAGKDPLLEMMKLFPWGWASLALIDGLTGKILSGLAWGVLIMIGSVFLFVIAMGLLERGFRQGFISLSEGEGGKRPKQRSAVTGERSIGTKYSRIDVGAWTLADHAPPASKFSGMWAVAKKDLFTLKRDTREWFGYMTPLLLMAFFIVQYLFLSNEGTYMSVIIVLTMYTIMFSGNLALQSFGREGESEWLLNSVPLTGWPVVSGKLLAAVLPTLILMEVLLVGTTVAIGLSASMIMLMLVSAVLLSLGSSAIGLYFSIGNCRYNPDKPTMRISPGASLVMYLINLFYLLLLGLGLCYLFPPEELISTIKVLPRVTYEGGFQSAAIYFFYLLTRPLLWTGVYRTVLGLVLAVGVWSLMFFGFMSATVRRSKKGLKVERVTNRKRRSKLKNNNPDYPG